MPVRTEIKRNVPRKPSPDSAGAPPPSLFAHTSSSPPSVAANPAFGGSSAGSLDNGGRPVSIWVVIG